MKRSFLLVVCGALLLIRGAFGQSRELHIASTGDGGAFHFVSRASLSEEALSVPPARVFRLGLKPTLRQYDIGSRDLGMPFLSADGGSEGVFAYSRCTGPCMIARPDQYLTLQRNGKTFEVFGYGLRVSRNGRFVYDSGFPSQHPGPRMIDLDSGEEVRLPKLLTRSNRHAVSDAGLLLSTEEGLLAGIGDLRTYRKVLLTALGQASRILYEGEGVIEAALSSDGDQVFVTQKSEAGWYSLLHFDVARGGRVVLWEGDKEPIWLQLRSDGLRVLLGFADELLMWDAALGWRHLLSHSERFNSSLFCDDGKTVFAVTGRNRYLRLDTESGELQELLAPFPTLLRQMSGGAYPGSLIRFESVSELPEDFRYELRAGDWKLPVLDSKFPNLDFQIPWEAADLVGRGVVAELSAPGSPMVLRVAASFAARVRPWAFTFVPSASDAGPRPNLLVAANADFSRRIDLENPAKPGELVHFWVTGLGPLDRALQTGEKGPVNPVARPLAEMACYLRAADGLTVRGLEMPTVIYAPGFVGVYQIDIILPADWKEGVSAVECRTDDQGRSFGEIAIRP